MNIEMTSPDLKKLSYVKTNADSITITKTTTRFEMFVILIGTLAVSLTLSLFLLNISDSKFLSALLFIFILCIEYYRTGGLRDLVVLNSININFSNNYVDLISIFNSSKQVRFNNSEIDVSLNTYSGRTPVTDISLKINYKHFLIMRYDTEYKEHHPEAVLLANYINAKLGYETIANFY